MNIRFLSLLSWLILVLPIKAQTSDNALSLWVGETKTIEHIDPNIDADETSYAWTCTDVDETYLTLENHGKQCDATFTKYVKETIKVICSYNTTWGLPKSKTYYLNCIENPVSLTESTLSLEAGRQQQLHYTHQFNNNFTASAIVYFDCPQTNGALIVDPDGTVKGIKPGTARVYVHSNLCSDENPPYCDVTVTESTNPIQPTSISLPNHLSITVGSAATLTPTITPTGASYTLSWSSSNQNVATVTNGKVTGVAKGTAIITVRIDGTALSASCSVTVTGLDPMSITLPSTLSLLVGETSILTPTVEPNGADYTISWTSSKKSVATVHNGVVTAIAAGTTRITATINENTNLKATCDVTVDNPTLTISAFPAGGYVTSGSTVTLTASEPDATIWYTLDGSTPSSTNGSQQYHAPIPIEKDLTLKAIATLGGYNSSSILTANYFIRSKAGDVNEDGETNIADVNADIDIILSSNPDERSRLLADINNDGEVTIADINAIIDIILTPVQALLLDNTEASLAIGEQMSVNILNGSGNFSTRTSNQSVMATINGNKLIITGITASPSSVVTVTDNVTGGTATLRVTVYDVTKKAITVNDVSFQMVTVPGGTFTMGGDLSGDGKPKHEVTLPDFCIGQTEVTQGLWQAVMGNNPSKFNSNPQLPVEQVSWDDCHDFIEKLNHLTHKTFRLPTEAEWEYAARGGDKSKGYIYAGSDSINAVAWHSANSSSTTHIVGSKAANELSLYDMSGNVNEWCQDWYGNYSSNAQNNPTGPDSGTKRVKRGGSWYGNKQYSRVAYRGQENPTEIYKYNGLRLAWNDLFMLEQTELVLAVQETANIAILNGNGNYSVSYTSSVFGYTLKNETLEITGKAVGSGSLTITDRNTGVKATLRVTVTSGTVHPTGITVNPTSMTLVIGQSKTVTATVTPSNAEYTLTWTSSNKSIATVSNGKVTAVGAGKATITASINGTSLSAKCEVTVTGPKPTSITLMPTSMSLSQGNDSIVTAIVEPSNADFNITWTSDNGSIASVISTGKTTAKVSANSDGNAVITATVNGASTTLKATCNVTVKTFRLEMTQASIVVGELLRVALINGNGSYSLQYSSTYIRCQRDEDVLEITGKKAGTCTVKVTDVKTGVQSVLTIVISDPEIETFQVNGVSFNMVKVHGGTFTMGATPEQGNDAFSDEYPAHPVTLSDYYIGQTEVTQELWQAVMGNNPSNQKSPHYPVQNINWNLAQSFITKLNALTGKTFTLPTEAEWEYAARGGDKSKVYKHAGSNDINDVAWYGSNSGGKLHDVMTKYANELGIYDMNGSIWEWTLDWYGLYSSNAQNNPTGPSTGDEKIRRGGCWNNSPRSSRVSGGRESYTPNVGMSGEGLRLAITGRFSLSQTQATIAKGETLTVNINNGSGSYNILY